MTGGYVVGGWGYVWAAYGITATVLLAYGVSLWLRFAAQSRISRPPSSRNYPIMDDTVRISRKS